MSGQGPEVEPTADRVMAGFPIESRGDRPEDLG